MLLAEVQNGTSLDLELKNVCVVLNTLLLTSEVINRRLSISHSVTFSVSWKPGKQTLTA